ncbi:hypothetical protein ACK2SD_02015 [Pseudomonas sp. SC11]|uniref:hypothetical protein n=1 Tax=Pseudomonas sp. SC11 TaxID=326927 RepID=UPI00399AD818
MSTIVKIAGHQDRFENGETLDEILRIKPWDHVQVNDKMVFVTQTSFHSSSDSSENSEFHIISDKGPFTYNKDNTPKTAPHKKLNFSVQLDYPGGSDTVSNPAAQNLFKNAPAHTLVEYNGNSYYIDHRLLIWEFGHEFHWVITVTNATSASV